MNEQAGKGCCMGFRRIAGCGFIVLFLLAGAAAHASSSTSRLGKIEFATSGSEEAQKHFLHGVAALHSFWYKEALEAFRQSTKIEPGFAMGYWGEAMAHNHPLWGEQDAQAAIEALAKIPHSAKATVREKAYMDAVRLLFGNGLKQSRDEAYMQAMEKIHRDYPDDLEAACFYSLSVLGASKKSDHRFRLRVLAGATAMDVFSQNPLHPCAAHYTIHAFDHPDLAILALPSARRYAQIAPASHHAQHMPAHIFLQLGLWQEAASANEAGWKSSVEWVKREQLPMGRRDYHSLQWLHYVYLQQGRWDKADEIFRLKLMHMQDVGRGPDGQPSKTNRRVWKYYERMAAASVIESERWELAETLIDSPGDKPKNYARASLAFARGFSAARRGLAGAERYVVELNDIRDQGIAASKYNRAERLDIWVLEIQAAARLSEKDYDEAIILAKKALAIQEELPAPSGPPRIIKPVHELYGEILLEAGRPEEALRQFAASLLLYPNRARSLLGAARSAALSGGKKDAADWYAKLLAVWTQADQGLPELREARDYLANNKK